mgnify:CR=1 FL=1
MKKTLCTLLLSTTLLTTVTPVLAENYTYKVYNPRTNKAYTAILGTLSITDYEYLWAFNFVHFFLPFRFFTVANFLGTYLS